MSEPHGTVLIVEDDFSLRRSLRITLGALDFEIHEAANGEEALTRVTMQPYDAVLLDINMPGMGGIEACMRIRRNFPRLPILLLTVRDSEDDKVNALDAGADDYITKPFQTRELAARIRSAIRRFHAPAIPTEAPLTIGDITLDPMRRRVTKADAEIRLTPREFKTIHLLMENAGKPITHARLLAALWGPGYGDEREYLRVLVSSLRKKVEVNPASPEYLLTESYIGYRFREA
ncbi:two-component system KDP operon response regulator KdpE [Silvibacterium bohemicum]|uniref:Two-component system KDP operon response regulator KdpE n=1 Tax=Silvibacterium bohemicum TaxID=1577686 RepID=A0A841JW02_9BACT|nr:response regulator transcription factor [Silvibacterium bohemicum]MBB6145562.1 two-component system KDP operon response regulator KdpE [Silvibacterium bohemicum]